MYQEKDPLKSILSIGNYLETKTEGKAEMTQNIQPHGFQISGLSFLTYTQFIMFLQ